MIKNTCWFIALAGVAIILSCNAQSKEPVKKASNELDDFIQNKGDSLLAAQKFPGLFIGVLNNGQRKYYSFGFADPDRKMAFDSATIFEIGSITKTFTAYVLENVLKEKGISDSSSILKYLPDPARQNKALSSISFLSLMNHTSGLPRLPDNMDLDTSMSPYDNYNEALLFTYLKTAVPKPNGKSSYSNLGAGLAGVLAARIAGKSYGNLLNEYIFSPFKITQHTDSSLKTVTNKSQGYFENEKAVYWKSNVLGPAYELKSSPDELLTYLQRISNPSGDQAKQIVGTVLQATAVVEPEVSVCRGWHTLEKKDQPIIYWHNGGTYGFSSFGGFISGKDKAVVVVVNQFNKNAVSDGLGFAILKRIAL